MRIFILCLAEGAMIAAVTMGAALTVSSKISQDRRRLLDARPTSMSPYFPAEPGNRYISARAMPKFRALLHRLDQKLASK